MRNKSSANIKAYKSLFNLERELRAFITKNLESSIDGGWISGMPPEIIKKCEFRAKREKHSYQDILTEDSDLIINYSDFKDLKLIILQNWSIFEKYFLSKDLIENKLEELEMPRNVIAHNRILSDNELQRILIYTKDLENCMKNKSNNQL